MKLEISAKDWNAIRLFIRNEEAILKDNYGVPGKKGKTWESECESANRPAFRMFDNARRAIVRAKVIH